MNPYGDPPPGWTKAQWDQFPLELEKTQKELEPLFQEIEDCQRLTAADYAVTILPIR